MGKSSPGLCEKRGEYLLGSLLDWREQPEVNKALWRKPAGSLHRSEARIIIYCLTARTLKFMLDIQFLLLQMVRLLGFSGDGTYILFSVANRPHMILQRDVHLPNFLGYLALTFSWIRICISII